MRFRSCQRPIRCIFCHAFRRGYGKLTNNQYFLGTMLFIGDYAEGTDKEIRVVDGRQHLTTITILFSALSDRFLAVGEDKLSKQIFRYIMMGDVGRGKSFVAACIVNAVIELEVRAKMINIATIINMVIQTCMLEPSD